MWNTASWSAWINWDPSASRPRPPPASMASISPPPPPSRRNLEPDSQTMLRPFGSKKWRRVAHEDRTPASDSSMWKERPRSSGSASKDLVRHVDNSQTKVLMLVDKDSSVPCLSAECGKVYGKNSEESEHRGVEPLRISNRHLMERASTCPSRRRRKQSSSARSRELNREEHPQRIGNTGTAIMEASDYLGSPNENLMINTSGNNAKPQPMQESVVNGWLYSLGLIKYAQRFAIHEVDFEVLPLLTSDDLKDMGIAAVGSRRKMLHAIQKLSKGTKYARC